MKRKNSRLKQITDLASKVGVWKNTRVSAAFLIGRALLRTRLKFHSEKITSNHIRKKKVATKLDRSLQCLCIQQPFHSVIIRYYCF